MLDSPDGVRRLEFVSQAGRTVLILRELLLRGEFRAGERLSELALVSRLGVSRTPIRFALDRLSHEGLLEPSPSGGYLVRAFTVKDIWDALEMRASLEGIAARCATERLEDPSELNTLRQLQSDMDRIVHANLDTFTQYVRLNEAFHFELMRLAKSPMLERSLNHLNTLPFAGPSKLVFARTTAPRGAELLKQGHQEHHGILDAIASRQLELAEKLTREHVALTRRNLEAVLSKAESWRDIPGAQLIRRSS
ncbi:MAG TPA: GntR family transcriptional regulator [Bryobacteraceae bacterium]|jgi:GntR family transcriptional regulator of vanillate catabolism